MFVADLVLYFPSRVEHRTAKAYFSLIDAGAAVDGLANSSMQHISDGRLMLGGVMGPLAATLYAIGFAQLFFSLQEGGVLLATTASVWLCGVRARVQLLSTRASSSWTCSTRATLPTGAFSSMVL